jgi:hypothetical protein
MMIKSLSERHNTYAPHGCYAFHHVAICHLDADSGAPLPIVAASMPQKGTLALQ